MLKKIFAVLVIVASFSLSSSHSLPSAAQAKVTCDPSYAMQLANALKPTGDKAKDVAALLLLGSKIELLNVYCNGLTFENTGNKVEGPFVLPRGNYKVTVKTKDAFVANIRTFAGSSCEADKEYSLFNELNLDGNREILSEMILPVGVDCKVAITTSNSSHPWTLTFEPIK